MVLSTNDLINILSQPPQPRKPYGFLLVMAGILLGALALTLAGLGLRQDLELPWVWLTMLQKTAILVCLFTVAFISLRRLAQPVQSSLHLWQKLLLPVFFVVVVLDFAFIPSAALDTNFLIERFLFCFGSVSLYGLAGMYGLMTMMRFYAPADVQKAGMGIGFAAAAAAALGYSVHCPVDHPLFILLAYGLPVAGLSWLGRKILPKYINW